MGGDGDGDDDGDDDGDGSACGDNDDPLFDFAVIFIYLNNTIQVHKALFKQAMRHWENYTCIQVLPWTMIW